ncbi:MAG: hypothetical protein KDD82_26875 [Planctomycetes bacterium]|nr:hypothetical protein [Planctomycetota bacterium]
MSDAHGPTPLERRVLALAREALEEPTLSLDARWAEHGDPYPVLDLLREAFGVELPTVAHLGATVADTARRIAGLLG